MAKKNEIPEEGGNINWDKLTSKPEESKKRKKKKAVVDNNGIEKGKEQLSKAEKSLPYPDEFLADINIMRQGMGMDNPSLKSDEEE